MKTLVTCVTERGQISIPAEIRTRLNWEPGKRLLWAVAGDECRLRPSAPPKRGNIRAMVGYAATFRKTRTTAEWMKELREETIE